MDGLVRGWVGVGVSMWVGGWVIYICIYVYTRMHTHTNTRTHKHTHTHTHTHTQMQMMQMMQMQQMQMQQMQMQQMQGMPRGRCLLLIRTFPSCYRVHLPCPRTCPPAPPNTSCENVRSRAYHIV